MLLALIIKTKKDIISESLGDEYEKKINFSEDDFGLLSFISGQKALEGLHTSEFGLKAYRQRYFTEIQKICKINNKEIYT
jgi:hypothetical protein